MHHHRALFLVLVLLGAGCASQPPKYVPGEMPTEAQLEVMSDAEKTAGMEEMMKQQPPQEMAAEDKQQETLHARTLTQEGTSERIGSFEARAHEARGSMRIVAKDGTYFLVLSDDFYVENGPYLVVHLSGNPNPTNSAELHSPTTLELAKLKSPTGGQMYEIPAGTDLSKIKSVVIYCKPFKVVFAVATIK